MRIIGIIPARLASTRFPEKVLASATGKPLIAHVYENARRASTLQELVIATDHDRIARACDGFGARVIMTDEAHPNGTSRLAQAARALGLRDDDIIVNVQGDEPEMEPDVIDACVRALQSAGADARVVASTVGSPWQHGDDPDNPAIVKVVRSVSGHALYFSRARIPFPRNPTPVDGMLRHVGIYAYRQRFLQRYPALAPTPLEQAESLEQLRILEHGFAISVAVARSSGAGIDTPAQYEAFVQRCVAARGGTRL